MDIQAFYDAEFDRHHDTVAATRAAVAEPFARLLDACARSLAAGGKIMLFGNGGSAADAQHIATELTVRYKTDRPALAALALTTDTSSLTAIGNDFGFQDLFARQVVAVGRPGDVAIGISTSGNSDNVLRGLAAAREKGCVAAGLGGRDGGRMVGLADPLLVVPSDDTARIQEMHILIGHMLCGGLEIEMGLLG
ncbi:MAG: D-sedoheptulose 7-phosphate isomerase [Hyphomicrobiales bacterium]|nr:D-sedoheptulose 7-phosphate isomerase [Hyphomicrobiales bacterium]